MDKNNSVPQNIIDSISPRIRSVITAIKNDSIQEIRLRRKAPVVIVTDKGSSFLKKNGLLTQILSDQCLYAEEFEINDTLNKCCGYSLHTYTKDLANGFVTLSCGARVGVCGTAVYENDKIKSIKDISSLNIRIQRNIVNSSSSIIDKVFNNGLTNLLIVGPPSSGKTTILKDLAFQISDGILGKYYKVVIADERMELSGNRQELGPNTDVLKGYSKAEAISLAVRTMSPEIIICDEIGFGNELKEIKNGINCGVNFILTVHSTEKEFYLRNDLIEFCNQANINNVAFLYGANLPGKISKVIKTDEVYKDNSNNTDTFISSDSKFKLYKAN